MVKPCRHRARTFNIIVKPSAHRARTFNIIVKPSAHRAQTFNTYGNFAPTAREVSPSEGWAFSRNVFM